MNTLDIVIITQIMLVFAFNKVQKKNYSQITLFSLNFREYLMNTPISNRLKFDSIVTAIDHRK